MSTGPRPAGREISRPKSHLHSQPPGPPTTGLPAPPPSHPPRPGRRRRRRRGRRYRLLTWPTGMVSVVGPELAPDLDGPPGSRPRGSPGGRDRSLAGAATGDCVGVHQRRGAGTSQPDRPPWPARRAAGRSPPTPSGQSRVHNQSAGVQRPSAGRQRVVGRLPHRRQQPDLRHRRHWVVPAYGGLVRHDPQQHRPVPGPVGWNNALSRQRQQDGHVAHSRSPSCSR